MTMLLSTMATLTTTKAKAIQELSQHCVVPDVLVMVLCVAVIVFAFAFAFEIRTNGEGARTDKGTLQQHSIWRIDRERTANARRIRMLYRYSRYYYTHKHTHSNLHTGPSVDFLRVHMLLLGKHCCFFVCVAG